MRPDPPPVGIVDEPFTRKQYLTAMILLEFIAGSNESTMFTKLCTAQNAAEAILSDNPITAAHRLLRKPAPADGLDAPKTTT